MNEAPAKVLVIDVAPKLERFDEVVAYFAQLVSIFEKFGATGIRKLRRREQLLGDTEIKATAIVDFPDEESIKDAFSSAEFAALENAHEILYETISVRICDGH